MTAIPPPPLDTDLRDRIEHAIRATAVSWATQPLTEHGTHNFESGCALCHGDAPSLTDAVLTVVQPELDRLRAGLATARAQVAAAYAFADEMGDYCSPHGVAAVYADRLRERLEAARES